MRHGAHHYQWMLGHPIFVFLRCRNTDVKSSLCALVILREMETPGQIWCKDLVLIVKVYAWQDPESFITWGIYVATQGQTCGTILGYEILLDAAQAAVFHIHFSSEIFATLFNSIQTYLVTYAFLLQLRLPFPAQWHMSWDRWWQRRTGREHLLPTDQAPASTHWQKSIFKKVTLVKKKLFLPSKSTEEQFFAQRSHCGSQRTYKKHCTFGVGASYLYRHLGRQS